MLVLKLSFHYFPISISLNLYKNAAGASKNIVTFHNYHTNHLSFLYHQGLITSHLLSFLGSTFTEICCINHIINQKNNFQTKIVRSSLHSSIVNFQVNILEEGVENWSFRERFDVQGVPDDKADSFVTLVLFNEQDFVGGKLSLFHCQRMKKVLSTFFSVK